MSVLIIMEIVSKSVKILLEVSSVYAPLDLLYIIKYSVQVCSSILSINIIVLSLAK